MPVPPNVDERIRRFKADLPALLAPAIVQRYITQGECFALDERQHIAVKTEVAQHFQIHPNEVVVVGSGKMGFSIAPDKRYRPFRDESDLDLAVVSATLFDDIWRRAYDYRMEEGATWQNGRRFADYLFRGWIRPDMLPANGRLPAREQWFEFFRTLSGGESYGRYQVRGGLYRTWYFLERYQAVSVTACQQELRGNDEDDLIG